jgi:hypothetical protein
MIPGNHDPLADIIILGMGILSLPIQFDSLLCTGKHDDTLPEKADEA